MKLQLPKNLVAKISLGMILTFCLVSPARAITCSYPVTGTMEFRTTLITGSSVTFEVRITEPSLNNGDLSEPTLLPPAAGSCLITLGGIEGDPSSAD